MDRIIMGYMGGLGNQMFQYALKLALQQQGNFVEDDLSFYVTGKHEDRPFVLDKVFTNVKITQVNSDMVNDIFTKSANRSLFRKIFDRLFPNKRLILGDVDQFHLIPYMLKIKAGYIRGYWQSYKYFESIENEVRKAYTFSNKCDNKILDVVNRMQNMNSISLHLRGGDYLTGGNPRLFGNICTKDYYDHAIETVIHKVNNPVFCVFSNDFGWAKQNFHFDNVVWMDSNILPEHEDWVDMMLMSKCKHNIIANSTFSWWGAWLNDNKEKMVIAPRKWLNGLKDDELCPDDWIRL